jgi:enoyl-CoA hydratase/carnithine racemase
VTTSTPLNTKVRLERDGYVATVTLDNPGTRNACSMGMWLAIRDVFRDLATSDARVVVLTGANGDFCSGADLSGSGEPDSGWEGNKVNGMRRLAGAVMAVHECPLPVIAKVDGVAVGAGFGLAMAADMLFCSERARFSAIFAKLGLSLDFGTSWFLVQASSPTIGSMPRSPRSRRASRPARPSRCPSPSAC